MIRTEVDKPPMTDRAEHEEWHRAKVKHHETKSIDFDWDGDPLLAWYHMKVAAAHRERFEFYRDYPEEYIPNF